MVPKNWSKVGFGEVVSLSKSRHNPKTSNNSYPCIELEHIEQGTGRIIGSTPSSSLNSTKSKFKKGDVIFGKLRPYLRKYAMPSFNGVCSTEIWVFKPSDKILKPYLYHLIQTSHFISEANKSSGSKMPRADWDVISEMVINLPPLPEQQKIAKILTTWDKAIDTTERLIDNSKQQKKALMQQLLTGKKRLLDENGKRFEGEWEEEKLGDLYSFKRGKGISKGQLTDSGNKCVLYGELYTYYGEVINEVKSRTLETNSVKSKKYDVLIPASTTTTGIDLANATAILEDDILLGGDINILRPKKSINSIFMAHLLTHFKKHEIARKAQGITIIHVYGKDLANIAVQLPDSLEEQQKIATVLTTADKEIELLEQQLADLQQEKKALMQVLLTGKVRVRVD